MAWHCADVSVPKRTRRDGGRESSFGGKTDFSIPVGDDPAMGSNRRKMEVHGEAHIAH
jgi:hypothetical protein